MLTRMSADTRAWIRVPVSAYSSSPTSRWMATMAPILARDSRSTPSTSSSTTSLSSILLNRRSIRLWPRRASALRSSGWKTMSAAMTPYWNRTSRMRWMSSRSSMRATR